MERAANRRRDGLNSVKLNKDTVIGQATRWSPTASIEIMIRSKRKADIGSNFPGTGIVLSIYGP